MPTADQLEQWRRWHRDPLRQELGSAAAYAGRLEAGRMALHVIKAYRRLTGDGLLWPDGSIDW